MSKWVFLTAAIVFSITILGGGEGETKQATSESPTPETRLVAPSTTAQTLLLSPSSSPTPSPTSSPLPSPTSSPTSTPAPVVPAPATPEKETAPPVSAVEVDEGNAKRREIALTFDAGASADPTPRILETLEKHKAPATMFLTGQWAVTNPALVKQIIAQGHELANHSFTHPEFTKLTAGRMREELSRTEAVVQSLTGRSTKPFFRPPFGDRDARVREVVAGEGYLTIFWTLDSTDWREEATAASVRNRVLRLASPGAIIVFHLGSEPTAQSIEEIILGLREKGFFLVHLSTLITE